MITLADMIILTVLYAFILSAVLISIRTSKKPSIVLAKRSVAIMAIRLAFVIASTYFVLCYAGGLHVYWVVVLSWFVLLLSIPATLREDSNDFIAVAGTDAISFAIILVILGPVYAVKQFILGFPERDLIVLNPPSPTSSQRNTKKTMTDQLKGQPATVTATLKPIGMIECDGSRFEAISFDGSLIEVGQLVQIGELQNQIYVVHPVSMDA